MGFAMSGCEEEECIKAEREREVRRMESKKIYQRQFIRSLSGYDRATTTATPGNPGQTSHVLTGPNGLMTTVTAVGFANDIEIGGLDNDGFTDDGAMAMGGTNNVTVIRIEGGTLQAPVQYSTGAGTNPVAVAVGDVNGDLVADLVTANAGDFQTGSVSIFPGTGGGHFGAAVGLTVGTAPVDVSLADLNGDGRLDLAVADGSASRVVIRLGTGEGAFGPDMPLATGASTVALRIVNWNPEVDSHEDIVTNGRLLLGRGDGTFEAPVNLTPGYQPGNLVDVEDLNGDGRPDLVLGTGSPPLATILLGTGDGGFLPPRHHHLYASPRAVSYFDETGDGVEDLLFSNSGDDATLLSGRGEGNFGGTEGLLTGTAFSPGGTSVVVADFTGEGDPDIVEAHGSTVFLLPGLGGGGFAAPQALPGLAGNRYRVVAGDWNGDEKPDLAFGGRVLTNSRELSIVVGLGGGAFSSPVLLALPDAQNSAYPEITVAFLNSDTAQDLLAANFASGDVSVFLGNGAGGFAEQARVNINTAPNTTYDNATAAGGTAVGDFNGDHQTDLVVAYAGAFGVLDGGLKICFGNGDGTFQTPVALRAGIVGIGVAAGDFNRDGNLDLALAMEQQPFDWDVAIYPGHGDGTFGLPAPLELGENLISGVVAGDGDGDGKTDLAVSVSGGDVLVLRGLGDGAFARVASLPAPGRLILADVNRDGKPDLLSSGQDGFLALRINQLPGYGPASRLLGIASEFGGVTLFWPSFFPDFILEESRDLATPFAPSPRQVIDSDGIFKVGLNPAEETAGFFRLAARP